MLSVLPVKYQGENGPVQGRTPHLERVLHAAVRGAAHTCVRSADEALERRTEWTDRDVGQGWSQMVRGF
jgi:hypothetical protein